MIYDTSHNDTIQQGDILNDVPYFGVMEEKLQNNWVRELKDGEPFEYKLNQPIGVKCIVLTQNCDIMRNRNLVVAKIVEINDFPIKTKSRVKRINEIIRDQTRAHYLPPSVDIDTLAVPHAIDFKEIFVVPSNFILDNISLFFVARMKPQAVKILQEKITRFFTRLAYDEEIFYTDEELEYKIQKGILKREDVERVLESIGRKLNNH